MKIIYCLGVLSLLLAGCQTVERGPRAVAVTLRPNMNYTIRLDANLSTGYAWELEGIVSNSLIELIASNYTPPSTGEGQVGATGTQTFVLRAKAVGDTTLVANYRRPWRQGNPQQNKYIIKSLSTGRNEKGIEMKKLTVYIPESHLEVVKSALFAVGAGRYKAYDCCSWQVLGTGQFRPLTGANPMIGNIGQLEQLPEWRVEMICTDDVVEAVRTVLRQSHPYEEPAFDFTEIG